MKKTILYLLFISVTFSVTAQNINDKTIIKTTLQNFFKGFHKGDIILLKTTIHNDIQMQSASKNSKGESILTTTPDAFKTLIKFAENIQPTDDYFEKILSYTIKIDGNLASVWTPYEFYIKGVFSHCGVNSFQVLKQNNTWKIIYIIDTRRKDKCNPLEK